MSWGSCDDNRAFLGVEEDSDEDEDEPGLVVEVVRGGGADKAGLRDNDLILKLNDSEINAWKDLTKFMSTQKPGDKVRIAYRRNGKESIAETALATRKEAKNENKTPKGFLGVSDQGDDDEDEAGVEVSITKKPPKIFCKKPFSKPSNTSMIFKSPTPPTSPISSKSPTTYW